MHQRGHAPPLAGARRFTGRPISDPSGKCWDPRPDYRHDKLQQLTPQPRSLGGRPPGIQTREVLAGKLREPRLVCLLSFLCWSKVCIIFHMEDPPPNPTPQSIRIKCNKPHIYYLRIVKFYFQFLLQELHRSEFCSERGKNGAGDTLTKVRGWIQAWVFLVGYYFRDWFIFPPFFSLLLSRFTFSVDKTHTVEKQISAVTRARYGIKLFAQPRQSA